MVPFAGQWRYRSYRPQPGAVGAGGAPPGFVVWSPPGVVTVEAGGRRGKLELAGVPFPLQLTFRISEGVPARLSILATAALPNGSEFTNELSGWFVPAKLGESVGPENPLVVRGCIVQTSPDIASPPQPIFTTGFFVLEPLAK